MTGLPKSLAIALWFVGSIWLVAIIAYATNARAEIVILTVVVVERRSPARWLAPPRSYAVASRARDRISKPATMVMLSAFHARPFMNAAA
jgi:hypothetical protein